MNDPDPSAPPSPRHAALAFAAGVALAMTALVIAECGRTPAWRKRAESRFSAEPAAVDAAPMAHASEPLAPFATLALAREELPAEGTVNLSLGLPEPSADAEPRPVTVHSMADQRVYSTQGRLDPERRVATIDVPSDFLQPGTYLVQIKTTERTPFPLRRYVVEVR